MMKRFCLMALVGALSALPLRSASLPQAEDSLSLDFLDSTVVVSSRASVTTPVSYTMIPKEQLRSATPSASLPMSLSRQPSVVTSNEGGTGLGYSKMSIRGVRGSHINVTLNGITLNDAESQEVFWVNIPALTQILSSVQLQRGLGTTYNGSGSFGASVNMVTSPNRKAGVAVDFGAGSFATVTGTVAASMGDRGGWTLDAVYNGGYTDGWLRGATARVHSAYVSLGWLGGPRSLQLTYLLGKQRSGITWNGISLEQMARDSRYNPAGRYVDASGAERFYPDETDNYTQQHLQLRYLREWGRLLWSTTLNLTYGKGYYENYKYAEGGFPAARLGYEDRYDGDFAVREWLDNLCWTARTDLSWKSGGWDVAGGLSWTRYDGEHYGLAVYSEKGAPVPRQWYRNQGLKHEENAYARVAWSPLEWLSAYADLQYRRIYQAMWGPDNDFYLFDYRKTLPFFNPRAGLVFTPAEDQRLFLSGAWGHREPARSDLRNDTALRPEQMLDVEAGWSRRTDRLDLGANLFYMGYRDMLVETGRHDDQGYTIKENVPEAFRAGLELSFAWRPFGGRAYRGLLELSGNVTASANKIKEYTCFVDQYDNDVDWTPLEQVEEHYTMTDILLSPPVTGALQAAVYPGALWTLTLGGHYVGPQYWDNTAHNIRRIPGYFVADLSVGKRLEFGRWGALDLGLCLENLFNKKYYADVWVYRARFRDSGAEYVEEGVFPQAPLHFMFKAGWKF